MSERWALEDASGTTFSHGSDYKSLLCLLRWLRDNTKTDDYRVVIFEADGLPIYFTAREVIRGR